MKVVAYKNDQNRLKAYDAEQPVIFRLKRMVGDTTQTPEY